MIVALPEAKSFLRIDQEYTQEDSLIETMIGAAEEYVEDTTAKTFTSDCKLAVIAVQLMVTHWYENRQAVLIGSISKDLEYSLSCIIQKLKYSPKFGTPIPEVTST